MCHLLPAVSSSPCCVIVSLRCHLPQCVIFPLMCHLLPALSSSPCCVIISPAVSSPLCCVVVHLLCRLSLAMSSSSCTAVTVSFLCHRPSLPSFPVVFTRPQKTLSKTLGSSINSCQSSNLHPSDLKLRSVRSNPCQLGWKFPSCIWQINIYFPPTLSRTQCFRNWTVSGECTLNPLRKTFSIFEECHGPLKRKGQRKSVFTFYFVM